MVVIERRTLHRWCHPYQGHFLYHTYLIYQIVYLTFICMLRGCTDVDSDVCKCRCRMSTGFLANVDGNVENISIYQGKKAQKNRNHMLKKCRIIFWYICIYVHTHTHTHPQKDSFSKHSHEETCKKLGTDSKKCQCRLKRPANVEHMSMSMVLQMSTRYGRYLCTPLTVCTCIAVSLRFKYTLKTVLSSWYGSTHTWYSCHGSCQSCVLCRRRPFLKEPQQFYFSLLGVSLDVFLDIFNVETQILGRVAWQ